MAHKKSDRQRKRTKKHANDNISIILININESKHATKATGLQLRK